VDAQIHKHTHTHPTDRSTWTIMRLHFSNMIFIIYNSRQNTAERRRVVNKQFYWPQVECQTMSNNKRLNANAFDKSKSRRPDRA